MIKSRQIQVTLENINFEQLSPKNNTIYINLFIEDLGITKSGKIEAFAESKIPFFIFYGKKAKRAALQDLSSIEMLAKRNHAKIDYEPVIRQGLEAYFEMEREKELYKSCSNSRS